MAPEMFKDGLSDERADCYSLGVVGFELLNGVHPFGHMDKNRLDDMREQGLPVPGDKPDYTRDPDFAHLIEGLMCPDVSMRFVVVVYLLD